MSLSELIFIPTNYFLDKKIHGEINPLNSTRSKKVVPRKQGTVKKKSATLNLK